MDSEKCRNCGSPTNDPAMVHGADGCWELLPADQPPQDDRRERYKTAMIAAKFRPVLDTTGAMVDAAMAVADSERQQIMRDSAVIAEKWADAMDENARLRTENTELRRDFAQISDMNDQISEDNARLRAELDDLRESEEYYRKDLARQLKQKDDLRATIERVRWVIEDSKTCGLTGMGFYDAIRAALEGEGE